MNEEKSVTEIILNFDDGSTRKLDKGFVCSMTPSEVEDGNVLFTFDMCDICGKELIDIVFGVLQLGDRLGMFGDAKEEACADEY